MNFFTSLAQLRHGFGGGAEAPNDPTPTVSEAASADFQFDAPAYKASLDLEPPAPILDDAAIMARAALAAQAVADAAEVDYAKHAQPEVEYEPEYEDTPDAFLPSPDAAFDADPDMDAELDQPLDAFAPDAAEEMDEYMGDGEIAYDAAPEVASEPALEIAEAPAPRHDPEPEPFLSAQEYYAPGMDMPAKAEETTAFDENAFVNEPLFVEPDVAPQEDAPALEDTLIADMLAQDTELDAPLMVEAPNPAEAEITIEAPIAAPTAPVSIETFELTFDAQDAAPVLMIEDFDPATDTLEIELIREPGDDRALQSTDMALFLNHDGAYGADIVLRMSDAVCSTLRLVGEEDIDLEAVQIDITDAA